MTFRMFDPDRDTTAAHRIWQEVGWIEDGNKDAKRGLEFLIGCSRARVAELNGAAECLVTTTPGTIRYLNEDLDFSCVSSVTTSRVARKQGLAGRLTAQAVAEDATNGALVAGLGMFEQGFYNRLGFGTGGYMPILTFDPARLRVPVPNRPPRRVERGDWAAMHTNRLNRQQVHGACNLFPAEVTQAETLFDDKKCFGLGFDRTNGGLSHHVWLRVRGSVEHGPYNVVWMASENDDQFLELLGVLKTLGDQVNAVSMVEPPHIQIQDLIEQPFKQWRMTRKGDFHGDPRGMAYWQMRMCDIPGCLSQTKLPFGDLRFNVELSDPIERLLPEQSPWRGTAGTYVVTLGTASGAERGHNASLPTLTSTINAFTRMWLGVRPATGLTVTDEFDGPRELLESLDAILRVPPPAPDWDF